MWRHGFSDTEREGHRTFWVIRPNAERTRSAFGASDVPYDQSGNRAVVAWAYLGARRALAQLLAT